MTSYQVQRAFDVKNATMAVFDDFDTITTSHLVQSHFMKQLTDNCYKIALSSTLKIPSINYFGGVTALDLSDQNPFEFIEHHICLANGNDKYCIAEDIVNMSIDYTTSNICSEELECAKIIIFSDVSY